MHWESNADNIGASLALVGALAVGGVIPVADGHAYDLIDVAAACRTGLHVRVSALHGLEPDDLMAGVLAVLTSGGGRRRLQWVTIVTARAQEPGYH